MIETIQRSLTFAKNVRLLIQMHNLYVKGEKHTSEYIKIEDEMIASWFKMDDSDCKLLDQLSEALLKAS